jgi:glycosyltransferase involved in cell wall biosynthesis
MVEIAGENAVLLEDPGPEAITAAIHLLCEPATRARYTELGKKNAQNFSWAKTVAQTLQVYTLVK